jgi:hypothetical protein
MCENASLHASILPIHVYLCVYVCVCVSMYRLMKKELRIYNTRQLAERNKFSKISTWVAV